MLCTAGEHLQFLGFPWHFPVLGLHSTFTDGPIVLYSAVRGECDPEASHPAFGRAIGRTNECWFFLFSRKWFPVVPFGSREPVGIGSPVPRYRDREPGTAHSEWKAFPLFRYPTARRPRAVLLTKVDTFIPAPSLRRGHISLKDENVNGHQRTVSSSPPARSAALVFANSPGCRRSPAHALHQNRRTKSILLQKSSSLRTPGAPRATVGGSTVESMMFGPPPGVVVLLKDRQWGLDSPGTVLADPQHHLTRARANGAVTTAVRAHPRPAISVVR